MSAAIQLDPATLPDAARALRAEVRAFLAEEARAGRFDPSDPSSGGRFSPEFSRRCGEAGYIGMTWPRRFGGGERSFLERYVVTEELVAANAPVWAHWVADRQSGPVLMRYASEAICADILPRIVRGECYFCIGMSEPDSGSDLFAARARAERVPGGYRVNGRKVWTSYAHRAHYMIALLRTSPPTKEDRRHGLTSFLVDMSSDGIEVNPIINLAGRHDFNEVVLEDVFVPDSHLLGEPDLAWKQATSELAYERAGPERFLETIYMLQALVEQAGPEPDDRLAEGIGRLVAQLSALRQMSVSVASMLEAGKVPVTEAALVKDLGTNWEQALPARVRDLVPAPSVAPGNLRDFETLLGYSTLIAPKLTIQGGTREILRGIIARGLGLR
ncbi:MAG: acyl-CoA dehydrogenase family protein [Ectothiorhodospiraceae bacterium]|nr:acyl-CoA dehydrogenase family protein [Chromatiales bacterium]MCP5153719.1 acyl-CoA dehydrogenase family protein [Ectothiorhodospiraceae bacterium]